MKISWLSILVLSLFMNSCADEFEVTYESYNQKVTIKNNNFTIVATDYTYDNPVSATPSGSSSRVVAENVPLTAENQKKLEEAYKTDEFFLLSDTLGAPEGERYYPETISVKVGNREKTVFYRSNPAYPAPETFATFSALILSCTSH